MRISRVVVWSALFMRVNLSGRTLGAAWLAVILLASHAAAQTFDPDLVARARAEKRLVFYTGFSGNQLYNAIKKGYEEAFGIPVDMLIARSSEVHERLRTEIAAGRTVADVLIHGESTSRRLAGDGLLQKFDGLAAEKQLAVAPSAPGYSLPVYMSGYSLMVNTSLVKPQDEPRSWRDLLDPKWTGKLLGDDPRANGAGHVLFSVMVDKFGEHFPRALSAQKVVFGRDLGIDQMRVARGEYALRFPQSLSNMRDLKGLPLKFIIPAEGLIYVRADVGIPSGAPRPNAAKLFIEYLLSSRTQGLLANHALIPVINDAPDASDPETRELVNRAKTNLMGTSYAETQEAMLALAREIYR